MRIKYSVPKEFKQTMPHWCGPASLHIIHTMLSSGTVLTQEEWAIIAKTDLNRGTTIPHLKRCLRVFGKVHVKKEEEFKLSDFGTPAIVYDSERDHWVVAVSAVSIDKAQFVAVLDPEYGTITYQSIGDFNTIYAKKLKMTYALMVK